MNDSVSSSNDDTENIYSPAASFYDFESRLSCSSILSLDSDFTTTDNEFETNDDSINENDSDQEGENDYIEHLQLDRETILSSIFEGFNCSDNDDSVVFSSDNEGDDDNDDENLFVFLNNNIRLNYYQNDSIDIWTLLDEVELFVNEFGDLYEFITNAIRACLPVLLAESNIAY